MKYIAYVIGTIVWLMATEPLGWFFAMVVGAVVAGILAITLEGSRGTSTGMPIRSESTGKPSSSEKKFASPSDSCWEAALLEFESGSLKAAAWAKAIASTNGNEAAAKASYLRIRAEEMAGEERVLKEKVEHEAEQQKIRSTLGTCPNCGNRVRLGSERCHHCNTMFLGSYRPRPLDEEGD